MAIIVAVVVKEEEVREEGQGERRQRHQRNMNEGFI